MSAPELSAAERAEVMRFGIHDETIGDEITHACPPEGSGLTPCCGRSPFELPMTDRMTLEPELVNCRGGNEPL